MRVTYGLGGMAETIHLHALSASSFKGATFQQNTNMDSPECQETFKGRQTV